MENVLVQLNRIGDEKNGFLISIESNINIGFEIERIYYIYNVKKTKTRGFHSHKNLQQLAWCPYGRIEILLDNGTDKDKFILDSPEKALNIGPGIWHEMKWLKSDSILCVAASEHYDENDYIRDYDLFLQMVNEGTWNEK